VVRLSPADEIQILSAKMVEKAQELKQAEERFKLEQQTRTQQFRELQSQITELSDRLVEHYTEDWVEVPVVPKHDTSGTKAARLKRLYERNPRLTIAEATRELENGRDDPAAQKRNATRNYLTKRGELQEAEDGSWTVARGVAPCLERSGPEERTCVSDEVERHLSIDPLH